MRSVFFMMLGFILLLAGCKKEDATPSVYGDCLQFGPGEEAAIVDAFLSLEDNSCISLKAGNYSFENLSIAGVNTVMITGAGRDKTVLDFSEQVAGGEGISVYDVTNFVIRDLKIMESQGDLLKIRNGANVQIRNVAAVWNSEADSTNGAYGFYPVLCTDVLIEDCYVQGASDAGIYVG